MTDQHHNLHSQSDSSPRSNFDSSSSPTVTHTLEHASSSGVGDETNEATDHDNQENLSIDLALEIISTYASFYLTFGKDDRQDHGLSTGIRCSVSVDGDNQQLLDRLLDVIEIGRVVESRRQRMQWIVSSRSECHELRDFIEQHRSNRSNRHDQNRDRDRGQGQGQGQGHKSGFDENESYEAWKLALKIMQPGAKLSKNQLFELAEMRDSMNAYANVNSRSESEIKALIIDASDG